MRQVGARTHSPSHKACEFDSPCYRFGAGPRGGAVGDAVCAKAEQPKKKQVTVFSCQMSAMFRVLRAPRKQKSVMRVCCFDACCPANLGTVRFLFGLVRFGLWFVSGFLAVLRTGSVNRFPVRFSTLGVTTHIHKTCTLVSTGHDYIPSNEPLLQINPCQHSMCGQVNTPG